MSAAFEEAIAALARRCGVPGAACAGLAEAWAFGLLAAVDRSPKVKGAAPYSKVYNMQTAPLTGALARADRWAESILDEVAGPLHRAGLTCFIQAADDVSVVLAAGDCVLEAVARWHQHFGGDEDRPHDMTEFLEWLGQLRHEHPFLLRRVSGPALELEFLASPAEPGQLAEEMERWCGEVVHENGQPGGLEAVARRLRQERRVRLWWD